MKSSFGEAEENTVEERIRRMRKGAVVCVNAVAGKKKFVVKFEDGQKK